VVLTDSALGLWSCIYTYLSVYLNVSLEDGWIIVDFTQLNAIVFRKLILLWFFRLTYQLSRYQTELLSLYCLFSDLLLPGKFGLQSEYL